MTARRKTAPAEPLSRRHFVTIVAAGSAALLAQPALAIHGGSRRRKKAAPAPKPQAPATGAAATQKEFERQRAGTLATLKTLREYPLPPGGDLPVVFRPQRSRRRER
jgi:hypothetical protein